MKVIRYKRQSKWQQPRKSPQLRVSSIKTKKNYFSLESFNLNGEFQKKANRLRLFFGRISGSLSSFSSKDRTRLFVVGGGCTLVNSLRETRYGVGRMKMSRESKNENGCKHGQSEQMCHVQLCGFSSYVSQSILFVSSLRLCILLAHRGWPVQEREALCMLFLPLHTDGCLCACTCYVLREDK